MSDAAKAAPCPVDGANAERVFTMPNTHFKRPPGAPPASGGGGYSHHGHSHGPGTHSHSH